MGKRYWKSSIKQKKKKQNVQKNISKLKVPKNLKCIFFVKEHLRCCVITMLLRYIIRIKKKETEVT